MHVSLERRGLTLIAASMFLLVAVQDPRAFRAQALAPGQPPAEMMAYVVRFTGAAPADCGRYLLARPFATIGAAERQQFVTCALDSAKARRPFWTFVQSRGVDSLVFQGFLGTAEGIVYRFGYDSWPCVSVSPECAGRFSIERCDKPGLLTNSRGAVTEFGCR